MSTPRVSRPRSSQENDRPSRRIRKLRLNLGNQIRQHTIELQKALGTEAMLRRITEKIRDTLDETAILQTAVRELAISLNLTSCHTCVYDLPNQVATVHCEYRGNSLQTDEQQIVMGQFPEVYTPLLQKNLLQFCPLPTYPFRDRVAVLVCPIADSQEVLGDIWLLHDKDTYFNPRQLQIVQQVAAQCAIAIRQSRLYQAAQGQIRELQKLNRLKDDFLSTTSHELRTPLSNIKMATQLLELVLQKEGVLPQAGEQPPSQELNRIAHCLQILKQECDREVNLINDLLTLQQLDAGCQPVTLSSICLQTWIPQVIETLDERFSGQQVWVLNLPPDLPPLTSDLFLFNRVLGELFMNAIKFTPAGEQIQVSIRFKAPKFFAFEVINTGIEIPASELDAIFDRFYRIPSTDPWKYSGTGLGLALAKKIVVYLGGNIQVKSASGQTCFSLELPNYSD